MNDTSNYLAAINHLLVHPTGGIVDLVDELLKICGEHHLELNWRPDRYLVRFGGSAWEEVTSRPHRSSVFRDMLARLGILSNLSPYGGQGQLLVGAEDAFQIDFSNTPAEIRLQLMPIRLFAPHESNGAASGVESERIDLQSAND